MLREHIATKANVGNVVEGQDRYSLVEVDPTNVTCFNPKNSKISME